MHPIVVHCASGWSFFTGFALVLSGLLALAPSGTKWRNSVGRIALLLGLVAAVAAALPWPLWFATTGAVLAVGFLFVGTSDHRRVRTTWRGVTVVVWMIGLVVAVRWQLGPSIPDVAARRIDVIGDSISADIGADPVWPARLADRFDVDVRNHARVGATVASALEQVERIEPGATLVLLEIGGNDLLGTMTATEFEQGLERLLEQVTQPRRVVVMLELPLPPTFEAFGRAQRRLANEHGVAIVPRRVLISVLAAGDATLDSIHLSPTGHRRMAETIWVIVGDAFPAR